MKLCAARKGKRRRRDLNRSELRREGNLPNSYEDCNPMVLVVSAIYWPFQRGRGGKWCFRYWQGLSPNIFSNSLTKWLGSLNPTCAITCLTERKVVSSS